AARTGHFLSAVGCERRGLFLRRLPAHTALAAGAALLAAHALAVPLEGAVRPDDRTPPHAPPPLRREDASPYLLRDARPLYRDEHRRGRTLRRAALRESLALSRLVLSGVQGRAGPVRSGPDHRNHHGAGPPPGAAFACARQRAERFRVSVPAAGGDADRLSAGRGRDRRRPAPRAVC